MFICRLKDLFLLLSLNFACFNALNVATKVLSKDFGLINGEVQFIVKSPSKKINQSNKRLRAMEMATYCKWALIYRSKHATSSGQWTSALEHHVCKCYEVIICNTMHTLHIKNFQKQIRYSLVTSNFSLSWDVNQNWNLNLKFFLEIVY